MEEEQLMEEEELEERVEPKEDPAEGVKGGTAWKIAKIHQRLGHPTKATLVKMLTLAGASKETLKAAEAHQCPTCETVAPPDRYPKVNPFVRTSIFGKEVHLDSSTCMTSRASCMWHFQ